MNGRRKPSVTQMLKERGGGGREGTFEGGQMRRENEWEAVGGP